MDLSTRDSTAMDSAQPTVLILTPFDSDVDDLASVAPEGTPFQRCVNLPELTQVLHALRGGAVVVAAEEAIDDQAVEDLSTMLAGRPVWSNLPFLLLMRQETDLTVPDERLLELFDNAHVTLLDRPVRPSTLARNLRFGLNARRRRRQIRDQDINAILQMRVRQQSAIAGLGQRAVSEKDLSALFDHCVQTVASVLENEYCKILELLPSRGELLLRAGVGWKEGLVGAATVGAGLDSQAGYTLSIDTPVIVDDLRAEKRFSGPSLLHEHHVVSGMSCVIVGKAGQPWGVLGTHTSRRQLFTEDDVHFLRAVASILTSAIQRNSIEQNLRESERRFREMIDALPAAIYTTDAEGRLTHFNPAAVEFSGRVPELGTDLWCVTWRLYRPDGTPMPHDECPMAIALKEGRIIRGMEAMAERPDGKRIWFEPYPTPLHDSEGRIVGGINMLVDITERKEAERILRRRDQHQALARGQEEERRRIARELHDDFAQRMAILSMQLDRLALSPPAPEEIACRIQSVKAQVEQLCDDLRDLSHRLHPALLDILGLTTVLQVECERASQVTGFPVRFDSDPMAEDLSSDLALALYRVVQEALRNSAQHAEARQANVALSTSGAEVYLKIEDDGKGFDPEAVRMSKRGLGLLSMAERLELFDGRLSIDSQPGKGTRIQAIVPLGPAAFKRREDSTVAEHAVDSLNHLRA